MRGRKTAEICNRARNSITSSCDNVIFYMGGNDVATGNALTSIENEIRRTIEYLNNGKRRVFLCTICPRKDIDVKQINDVIRNVCNNTFAELIDVNSTFVFGNGAAVDRYFVRDGIHLNLRGSSFLVNAINAVFGIVRNARTVSYTRYQHYQQSHDWNPNNGRRYSQEPYIYCSFCRMTNHSTQECRRRINRTFPSTSTEHWSSVRHRRRSWSPRFYEMTMNSNCVGNQ